MSAEIDLFDLIFSSGQPVSVKVAEQPDPTDEAVRFLRKLAVDSLTTLAKAPVSAPKPATPAASLSRKATGPQPGAMRPVDVGHGPSSPSRPQLVAKQLDQLARSPVPPPRVPQPVSRPSRAGYLPPKPAPTPPPKPGPGVGAFNNQHQNLYSGGKSPVFMADDRLVAMQLAYPRATQHVQQQLHSGSSLSPRGEAAWAAEQQAVRPRPFVSPIEERLYRARHGNREVQLLPKSDLAEMGRGRAYVSPDNQIPSIDIIGRYGVANHEAEHAWDQANPKDVLDKEFDDRIKAIDAGNFRTVNDDFRRPNAQVAMSEVAPVIGDLAFGAERFRQEQGKPLQHKVTLPGGVQHDINWIRDQAKQHGYFGGRSMSDLIFNTPEGLSWYKRMLDQTARQHGGVR